VRPLARRLGRVDPHWWDAALAAVAVAIGEIELLTRISHVSLLGALGVGAAYATLAWRRRRPLLMGVVTFALWVTMSALVVDVEPLNAPLVAVLVMAYAMGRYTSGAAVYVSLGVVVAGLLSIVLTMEDQVATDFVFPTAFGVIAWVAGRSVRTRSQLTEELHEAAVRAEEAHDAELARAAAEERRRIAREMHDVVAHSVSVMVVQAGGARRILERDPERAVEAARHIEETGRAALVEMRRLLGVLHQGDDAAADRAPAPGMVQLGALVERARAAGLPVTLTVAGEPRSLPAGLDLAAYRVLQESLTNVLKHGGSAPTEVLVRWGDEELELAVADRGPGPGAGGDGVIGGHGLVGMAERMRLYGGELHTGRRDGGGFEVRARIPLAGDREVQPA
jgi:signal transduction histidine kinase